jgi:hypothetical protein
MDELLAAETGVHGHHTDHIHHVQKVRKRVNRCPRIDRQPGLGTGPPDRLQGAVNMRPRLEMRADIIGPRPRKGLDIGIDRRDHQMHVHHPLDVGAQCRAHRRAECDVGHEMPVHHIDMHPIGALRLDRFALGAEIGEIRRQDRGCDFQSAVECHWPSPLGGLVGGLARKTAKVTWCLTGWRGTSPLNVLI